ncbi:MAG: reverse transcriptase family protein, partial [Proteobacteria bacterium]|nr:reverse transcriptase family protein [Pseudomonadota bacterium]
MKDITQAATKGFGLTKPPVNQPTKVEADTRIKLWRELKVIAIKIATTKNIDSNKTILRINKINNANHNVPQIKKIPNNLEQTATRKMAKEIAKTLSNKILKRQRANNNKAIHDSVERIQNMASQQQKDFFKYLRRHNNDTIAHKIVFNQLPENNPLQLDEFQKTMLANSEAADATTTTIYNTADMLKATVEFWQYIFANSSNNNMDKAAYLLHLKDTDDAQHTTQVEADITPTEIVMGIKAVKSNSAPGPNMIGGNILKALPELHLKAFMEIITAAWELEWKPQEWEKAHLLLFSKKGNREYLTNYRPIQLQQTDSKVLANVIHERIQDHIERNHIIENLQFGFRRNVSIAQCLFTFLSCLEDGKAHNKSIHVLYLDFAKAFDCVNHELLFATLEHYGICPKIIRLIQTLYENNHMETYAPYGKGTTTIKSTQGVKQGCVLSPILYTLFINILLTQLRTSQRGYKLENGQIIPNVTFCDDNTLIAGSHEDIQALLKIVEEWCKNTGMRLNPSKCTYTYKEQPTINPTNPTYTLKACNQEIPQVSWNKSQRLLGLEVNLDLDWSDQENKSIDQFNTDLLKIYNTCLNFKQKAKVINLVFAPKIYYRMAYFMYTKNSLDLLNKLATDTVKSTAHLPGNTADHLLWRSPRSGGVGLSNLEDHNKATFLTTVINHGLNSQNLSVSTATKHMLFNCSGPTRRSWDVATSNLPIRVDNTTPRTEVTTW